MARERTDKRECLRAMVNILNCMDCVASEVKALYTRKESKGQ